VKLTAAPGLASSRTFTLRDDGTDTTVSCAISGSATTCDSAASTATIAAASELSVKVTNSGGPNLATALFGWRATTP
jgi:hypothetical protein